MSDGRQDVEAMAAGARERGYEYLAITDHSATHGFGNHVTPDQLREQIERIRALDAGLDGFDLLIGTETNILPDGSLDYDDELLEQLDWVVASAHTSFNMSEQDMTARMVAAIEHPLVDVIGHPTGRKIETRAPYAIDMEQVIEAAARTHTMLEINAAPDRRDLNELNARAAAAAGRADRARLRRALGAQPRADAVRRRDGAARLAHAGPGRQHAPLGGAGQAAEAQPRRRMSVDSPVEDRGARRASRVPVRGAGRRAVRAGRRAAGDVVRRARARHGDAGLGRDPDVADRVRRAPPRSRR